LIDGELKYVERSALKPIVSQAGQEVSIEYSQPSKEFVVSYSFSSSNVVGHDPTAFEGGGHDPTAFEGGG
jgi:hypothetical protein